MKMFQHPSDCQKNSGTFFISAIPRLLLGGILLVGLILGGSDFVQAEDTKQPKIVVKNAWVRAVPPVSKNSAAYLILQNHQAMEDRLLAVQSEIAEVAELHEVVKKGSMSSMQLVPHIVIAAHGTTELKPSGLHIMLINLKVVPKEGEQIALTLIFEHAGEVKLMANVLESQIGHDHD